MADEELEQKPAKAKVSWVCPTCGAKMAIALKELHEKPGAPCPSRATPAVGTAVHDATSGHVKSWDGTAWVSVGTVTGTSWLPPLTDPVPKPPEPDPEPGPITDKLVEDCRDLREVTADLSEAMARAQDGGSRGHAEELIRQARELIDTVHDSMVGARPAAGKRLLSPLLRLVRDGTLTRVEAEEVNGLVMDLPPPGGTGTGNVVACIKHLRVVGGLGLREAKECIDLCRDEAGVVGRPTVTVTSSSTFHHGGTSSAVMKAAAADPTSGVSWDTPMR